MRDHTLRDRLDRGETAIGTFQLINSPVVTETAGLAGMDFVVLDQEHGPLSADDCQSLAAAADAAGIDPVVRVRENAGPEIQRALDIGAAGVQIPQVETAATARAAADAARFDPIGERGFSPYVRAGNYVGSDDYTEAQNERVTVIVHIEGERGVENLDEIMDVDGIDVLFLGPYDLSQSLGIPGQVQDSRVVDLMEDACERAGERGVTIGTYADDVAMAKRWIDAGVQYVTVKVDAPLLHQRFEQIVDGVDP
jgi:4-hydroxy-2-oxoheptanedioate aldolase